MTTMDAVLEATYASRGRILQLTIEMETLIDIYISEYFVHDEDKQRELTMLILSPKVNLAAKTEILSYLLAKNPDNKASDIKILTENITTIIAERNIFAHWPVDFSKPALQLYEQEKSVKFIKLKQHRHEGNKVLGMEYQYKEENVNKIIGLIREVNNVLKKLVNM